ncbi:hypothetical protein CRI94_09945 [Longibacter salinarum]|uniref:DUF3177 domain-containing protein n=1 Tax=Longibacter salinarum TaxID=1850348 RepID=A0A2A8CY13_9BACT|nr:DUF3177 family protein [Longibacter salinarum]PEN13619.1 hypothetical protein CRI94_09945 [Longibacter salinarum]
MSLYRTLIHADFVIAVILLVLIPLGLLGASWRTPSVRDRMLVYWRASALLGITVYLWIGEVQLGFVTGWLARAIIPLALWRGDALTILRGRTLLPETRIEEAYRDWQRIAMGYSIAGLIYMLPLLLCAFGSDASEMCRAWYVPPKTFASWLHPNIEPIWLGRYGRVALGVYAAYLIASAYRLRR